MSMQRISRHMQRKLAKLIAAAIVAVVGAVFGLEHLIDPPNRADERAPEEIRGAARAIDGDSLKVNRHDVRLKGIDAPEGSQSCERDGKPWACGEAARDALRRLVGRDVVVCQVTGRDKHGRLLSYCMAGDRDLNGEMVRQGMAVSYGDFSQEEAEARRQRSGLWASEFQQPREWRRERGIGQ